MYELSCERAAHSSLSKSFMMKNNCEENRYMVSLRGDNIP